jgi:hypothetical protein
MINTTSTEDLLEMIQLFRTSSQKQDFEILNKKLMLTVKENPMALNEECPRFKLESAEDVPLLGHLFICERECSADVIDEMILRNVDMVSNPNSGYAPLSSLLSSGRFELFCKVADIGVKFDEEGANAGLITLSKSVLTLEQGNTGDSKLLAPAFRKLVDMGGSLGAIVKRKTTVLDYVIKNGDEKLSDELSSIALTSLVDQKLKDAGPAKVITFTNAYNF